jgi:hypothetical protein
MMKKLILTRTKSLQPNAKSEMDLELVSTQMLKQILSSRDKSDAKAVEDAANTASEGVLARHAESGSYEIIDEAEFETLLGIQENLPELRRPADVTMRPLCDYAEKNHFSLVSSKALRRALGDDPESAGDDEHRVAGLDANLAPG